MSSSNTASWRGLGDAISRRYSRSTWRLGLLTLAASLPLVLLYLWRGFTGARLPILGAAGVLVASFCFMHPFASLLGALFIAMSGLDFYLPGPIFVVLLGLALVRVAYDVVGGQPFDLGSRHFRIASMLLFAVAVTSLLVARDMEAATNQLYWIALGVAQYVAVSQLANRPSRIALVIASIGAGFAVSMLVTLRSVPLSGGIGLLMALSVARVGGVNNDPNISAMIGNCLVPLLVCVIGRWRGWRRLPLLPVLLLCVVQVLLAASRAGTALLVFLLLILMLRVRRYRGFAFATVLGLGVVVLLIPSSYWLRFESLLQLRGITVDRSLQLRQHVLEVGWQLFATHPWLGVGLGNFASETPRYMSVSLMAHNTYLEIAASLGVFGLLAYLYWLGSGLGMARHAATVWRGEGRDSDRTLADMVLLSLFVFCASAATLSVPFFGLVWLLLGLSNAARRSASSSAA